MKIGEYYINWKHLVKEGRTICSIYKGETLLHAGIAHLAETDQYDRRVGRKVSLARALKNAELDKGTRTAIWTGLRKNGVSIKN